MQQSDKVMRDSFTAQASAYASSTVISEPKTV